MHQLSPPTPFSSTISPTPRSTRPGRSHSALPKLTTEQPQAWDTEVPPAGTPTTSAAAASGATAMQPESHNIKHHSHRHTRSLHHHHNHYHLHHGLHRKSTAEGMPALDVSMSELTKRISRMRENYSHGHKRDEAQTDEQAEQRQLVAWAQQEERESRLSEARNQEIRAAYQNISTLSMDTTRRLDNVYYSILEKLSILQSTIGSLRDLSNQTKELGASFDSDANQVKNEIQEQINTFGGFEKQNQRIESLEYRIKQSKERTDSLTQRLDAARGRVGALENQEAEVQATITFQFRIVWAALAALVVAILAGIVFNAVYSHSDTGPPMPYGFEGEDILKSVLSSLEIEVEPTTSTSTMTVSTSSNYDPLILFEEL